MSGPNIYTEDEKAPAEALDESLGESLDGSSDLSSDLSSDHAADDAPIEPSRRSFLKGSLFGMSALLISGAGFYEAFWAERKRLYPGQLLGASAKIGHLLRDDHLPAPEQEEEVETVIIGGGVSGLSAAWWLGKNKYRNFKLLELEENVGGNSQFGKNEIGAYPWGAHYLPLPSANAVWVREFLEETKVIESYDERGLPVYNELYLCADPHERLFIQGRWQEGLVPQTGITEADRSEYEAFFGLLDLYKNKIGRDGKRAFSIPVDLSSHDPELMALDRISMSEFMSRKGWTSKPLNWYVNYCCRDDYGVGHDKVSAWAGFHYFASRVGVGANADAQTVLTWPEGNGWLVSRLREKSAEQIQSQRLVRKIAEADGGVTIDYLNIAEMKNARIRAKQVIFAAPRFVASHVIAGYKSENNTHLKDLRYAPWLVANVSLSELPKSSNGAPLSWDNVSYYSQSLGYVVSTHQNLTLFPKQTVLTFYFPLDHSDPIEARKNALRATHQDWAQLVAADLEKMHRGLSDKITNIDVWVWGHGMISPEPGFIWGKSEKEMQKSFGSVHFAHSDMSGISIFEEAQYRGVRAAQKVLKRLGRQQKNLAKI